MVPERSSLVGSGEVVQERVAGRDGTLVDESRPICPVRSFLEETVPMLRKSKQSSEGITNDIDTYNSRRLEHRTVGELVDHIDLEVIALQEAPEVSIVLNGMTHSTNLDARNERTGKLPIYHYSSTGEAIRGDVRVRDGQICDRANGGACARNGEAQGKKYCDLCTHAHGGKERRGCQCVERKARKTRGR